MIENLITFLAGATRAIRLYLRDPRLHFLLSDVDTRRILLAKELERLNVQLCLTLRMVAIHAVALDIAGLEAHG